MSRGTQRATKKTRRRPHQRSRFRLLRSWFRLSRTERLRTLEAAALLAAAWMAVRMLPFRCYAPLLGRRAAAAITGEAVERICSDGTTTGEGERIAHDVARSLRRAVRHLPWHSTCLMRALASQSMLRRRRCRGVVFLGVARREADTLDFHAWVRVGSVSVCGGIEAPAFTVVATFR